MAAATYLESLMLQSVRYPPKIRVSKGRSRKVCAPLCTRKSIVNRRVEALVVLRERSLGNAVSLCFDSDMQNTNKMTVLDPE